nr:restriction endonuclease subunit S [Vibrio parahaemolyticus]
MVRLGDVLSSSKYAAAILPDEEYKEVTVRLWGKGVNLRGVKRGSEIGTGKRFYVSPGQFILSKIDARHGAFGVVPDELDGAVVTSDFPVFDTDTSKLDVEFLEWLSKTPWFIDACRKASEGTTNRVRLKEKQLLEIEIRLPQLDIQQEIISKIKRLVAKLREAHALREDVEKTADALLNSAFQALIQGCKPVFLHEIAPIQRRAVELEIDSEYPELGTRSFGKGTFHKPSVSGAECPDWQKFYWVHEGDLIFNLRKAWEGSIAHASEKDHMHIASHNSYITCTPKDDVALSSYLSFYFLSNEGLLQVKEASRGSADRNKVISIGRINEFTVRLPSYEKQVWFAELQQKVADIKQAQLSNAVELEALMPSILDKAFKGELV